MVATSFDLDNARSLLARTPSVLNALLRDQPDIWTMCHEGDGTWNALDVVAHLVHAELSDWMPRVHMVLQFGEARTFPPFDRLPPAQAVPSMAELLDEFAALRTQSLADLDALHLGPEDLARRGRHPAFGVVRLSELLATWATHDLTHLHQLSRVMAHQYRAAVGPWAAYLGVLHCTGHSS